MYDIAFALESYTIPEYEIATEGLVGGVIKVILAFLKSFKGKLLAIVSAIVAILVASKKKGNNTDNSEPEDEQEPPKKSTGYNYTRRPNATIVRNNPQEPQQKEEPSSFAVNSRYKPGPKVKSAERGTRDEIRERQRIASRAKILQNIINHILHNVNRGFTGTKRALDTLVENRNKPGSKDIDKILLHCRSEIGQSCDNIDYQFDEYNDFRFGEYKDKVSFDNTIYKKLAGQKRSIESMIKMLDGLISRYTKDKRFAEDDMTKEFIKDIPKDAAMLVARITKTLTIIKLHAA